MKSYVGKDNAVFSTCNKLVGLMSLNSKKQKRQPEKGHLSSFLFIPFIGLHQRLGSSFCIEYMTCFLFS